MEDKTYKIIVRNEVHVVTFRTIESNYKFTFNYNDMAEYFGLQKDEGFETIEQYIDLLERGKINYFNFTLGTSIPIITFENSQDMEIVHAFFSHNKLSISRGTDSLMFCKSPDVFDDVRDFCLKNNIAFSTDNIDI